MSTEAFVPQAEPTLEQHFAECATSHQTAIKNLATMCEKTWQEVYGWWREYCDTCRMYDQSAVWQEFLRWYADKLGPPLSTTPVTPI